MCIRRSGVIKPTAFPQLNLRIKNSLKSAPAPCKRCIPVDDMVEKIQVSVDARIDKDNFLIIALNDIRASAGFDAALTRLEAYGRAGTDILFFEARQSEDKVLRACEAMALPMMASMSDGGKTPILPANVLKDMGYAFAIYPAMTSLVAASAMELSMLRPKYDGLVYRLSSRSMTSMSYAN